jgi:hydroxymethylbilane synthase
LGEGFELAAVLPRAGHRDAVVTRAPGGLAALPGGAVVGTGSVRRACQLRWLRPDLTITDLRGNVPTRLAKLAAGKYDAILLAEAGMVRLGHDLAHGIDSEGAHLHVEVLAERFFYPAAGQGAIGLEVRAGDAGTAAVVKTVNDDATWWRVLAEREFLRLLEAGCHTPVGVWTSINEGVLQIEARVFPEAGGEPLTGSAQGPAREALEIAARLYRGLGREELGSQGKT